MWALCGMFRMWNKDYGGRSYLPHLLEEHEEGEEDLYGLISMVKSIHQLETDCSNCHPTQVSPTWLKWMTARFDLPVPLFFFPSSGSLRLYHVSKVAGDT
ncbi:hypothetical protein SAY87_023884 [Trapa incisa]|uniref:Uncharacterized protein n=1 Tax=Trapa incisa TaxID=236973 RepID=A0AAN7QUP8_9MYRT|nr:hypothetical protein SAY87_023884 [Trapa incisa]